MKTLTVTSDTLLFTIVTILITVLEYCVLAKREQLAVVPRIRTTTGSIVRPHCSFGS